MNMKNVQGVMVLTRQFLEKLPKNVTQLSRGSSSGPGIVVDPAFPCEGEKRLLSLCFWSWLDLTLYVSGTVISLHEVFFMWIQVSGFILICND